jgi:pyrimidine oxygenase
MLDELSEVPGVTGVMMTFDDFIVGMEQFGTRILPLMTCRAGASRIEPHSPGLGFQTG